VLIAQRFKVPFLIGAVIAPALLAGCSQTTSHSMSVANLTDSVSPTSYTGYKTGTYRYTERDRQCLARAMFFESNRSSRDGMIAVGTVVINRFRSGKHGNTICDVVGEPLQFAPGALTRPMNSRALPDVMEAADAVLKGERSPSLKQAMFFHTAGLKFPYKNMHYVLVAGGNAFYEKRSRNWQPLPPENGFALASAAPPELTATTAVASAAPAAGSALPGVAQQPAVVQVASAEQTAANTGLTVVSKQGASSAQATAQVADASLPDAAPLPSDAPQPAVIASAQQPDPTRFGTAPAKHAVYAVAEQSDPQSALGYESTPNNTTAIGAMIAGESRPDF
jgi:spore germination cell wall hydrolase CwlJ-like protein